MQANKQAVMGAKAQMPKIGMIITLLIKIALRAAIVFGLTLAVAGCVSLFAAILITNAVVLMPLGMVAQIAGLSIYTCAQSALDGFPMKEVA